MKLGTVLIWLGIGIAIAGILLLVYHAMTCCPCLDDQTEGELCSCFCGYAEPFLIMVIGVVIAIIGFLIRSRHRRGVASEKRP